MKSIEHNIQRSCVTWFRLQYRHLTPLLFAVPNGQRRSRYEQAEKKAEGMVAGVADMILLAARCGYHGLCIEFKHDKTATADKTYQSKEQKAWQQAVENEGYKYAVVRSFDEFKDLIEYYISHTESKELKDIKARHNICGSDATTIDELIDELKCDNLELKSQILQLKSQQ